ncbi:MAG TPA: hypothetical protein VKE51_24340 [Vicinamibacterales bacterium]|nr:hypothetical protein [Vicinamibacterales bacterium]
MHVLLLGGTADERAREALRLAPAPVVVDAATLPFVSFARLELPPSPRTILIEAIERAFPDNQIGGTRLVLTQSTYLTQKLIDALGADDCIVMTGDRGALEQCAPEALQARGPWRRFEIGNAARPLGLGAGGLGLGDSYRGRFSDAASPESPPLSPVANVASPQPPAPSPVFELLAAAYASRDAADRLRLCLDAAALDPGAAVAQLALASAYREHQDLRARDALARAAALAPAWEAIHYELGKLWLALDDTARARDSFQRAADLMPTFSAAFSNLGATLGELSGPDAALAAFHHALANDPGNHTILSNIGVVSRERGQLDESEAALRQVTTIAPEFVFGHYNLGHTLFLAARYAEAIAAYEEGARRDPRKTPQQICRLAMARFAAGDVAGAERDLWPAVSRAAADEREDLLLEAYEIAHALGTVRPPPPAQQAFAERLAAEIVKSG